MIKAVVGANWGDEGKGKITDMLAKEADIIVRYQGGANAGHTIVNDYGNIEDYSFEEAKPEYQDVVESEEESDWVKGQDEWMNASESERTEIRKADAEKYGYEYDPTDYE